MLNETKKRVLLELNGRDAPVTLQELCQVLDLDPVKTEDDFYRLRMDNLVEHVIGYPLNFSNPTLRITWIGRDQLQRQLDAERRPAPAPEPSPDGEWRHRWARVTFGRWGLLFWAVVLSLTVASWEGSR